MNGNFSHSVLVPHSLSVCLRVHLLINSLQSGLLPSSLPCYVTYVLSSPSLDFCEKLDRPGLRKALLIYSL